LAVLAPLREIFCLRGVVVAGGEALGEEGEEGVGVEVEFAGGDDDRRAKVVILGAEAIL